MNLDKTFLVLGSGMTGKSVASFFDRKKVTYRWIDESGAQIFPPLAERKRGKALDFEGIACAVASPHYVNRWVLYELDRYGIPVLSDVELFSELSRSPILAVTGTNGKSTTVSLLADMLGRRGKCFLLGNIGVPCLDYIEETAPESPAVLEVSSFQLDKTVRFHPHVAAILNLTPDHLDFHKSYDNYKRAKFKIFQNQTEKDFLVLNADERMPAPENVPILPFSLERRVEGAYLENGTLCFRGESILPADRVRLEGRHNLADALCALAMAKCYGLDNDSIAESLQSFGGIAHRLQRVGEKFGKIWINDSKATNIASCVVAVNAFAGKGKICLIAGGRSVENFDGLVLSAVRKCAHLVVFGESAGRIGESCKKFNYTEIEIAENLHRAVELAARSDCDVVLFSPACKSFDGYRNFEERGADFVAALNER